MINFSRIWLCLAMLAGLLGGGAVQAQGLPGTESRPSPLELMDPLRDVIMPRLLPIIVADVSPSLGDATLINRINFVLSLGMVDAAAPFHETAVGMYTRIPRVAEAERSDRNINTAMLHAAYQTLMGLLPNREPVWREMLSDYGLNPKDNSSDLSTPVGIGNVAGRGALAGRLYDGMNQLGNYQDTTGYMPVNSAYALRDPSRWQPGLRLQGAGIYAVQHFVTPQLANVEPFAPFDPRSLRVPPPIASDVQNWDEYKTQVNAVLEVSENLTDEEKLKAEVFNNKIVSLGMSYLHRARELGLSPVDTVRGYFLKVAAILDASIVIWQEKARYDAVRPFSAIRHVYGDELVTAWAGPGEGTGEIPASQWQAYLPEADHPEYPSASTCGCQAAAQAMRRFTGTDELNWSVSYPAGASSIEPGITPARDLTLTFETWTDFAEDCGQARIWAGVHFPAAVEASAALCSSFGDMAYDYFSALMDGSADLREPAQALSPDPWMQAATPLLAEPISVPPAMTPTPEACEAVSDSILVTSVNSGIECHTLDTSGLQLLTGFLDAVSIDGPPQMGVQVCFRESGALVFLDMNENAPRMMELTAYQVSGMICGWIDRPGTVVLVAPIMPADSGGDPSTDLIQEFESCQVTTRTGLNFRDKPGGERLAGILAGARLTAIAQTEGWFNVQYDGKTGWISADHAWASATCQ